MNEIINDLVLGKDDGHQTRNVELNFTASWYMELQPRILG